jgi:gas vesicle protein
MSDDFEDIGTFFAGFLIGGLVGAAVALLLAPQSGEETRAIIRDKSIELKDKASESALEMQRRAEKTIGDVRTKAGESVEELRLKTEEISKKKKPVQGTPPTIPEGGATPE